MNPTDAEVNNAKWIHFHRGSWPNNPPRSKATVGRFNLWVEEDYPGHFIWQVYDTKKSKHVAEGQSHDFDLAVEQAIDNTPRRGEGDWYRNRVRASQGRPQRAYLRRRKR